MFGGELGEFDCGEDFMEAGMMDDENSNASNNMHFFLRDNIPTDPTLDEESNHLEPTSNSRVAPVSLEHLREAPTGSVLITEQMLENLPSTMRPLFASGAVVEMQLFFAALHAAGSGVDGPDSTLDLARRIGMLEPIMKYWELLTRRSIFDIFSDPITDDAAEETVHRHGWRSLQDTRERKFDDRRSRGPITFAIIATHVVAGDSCGATGVPSVSPSLLHVLEAQRTIMQREGKGGGGTRDGFFDWGWMKPATKVCVDVDPLGEFLDVLPKSQVCSIGAVEASIASRTVESGRLQGLSRKILSTSIRFLHTGAVRENMTDSIGFKPRGYKFTHPWTLDVPRTDVNGFAKSVPTIFTACFIHTPVPDLSQEEIDRVTAESIRFEARAPDISIPKNHQLRDLMDAHHDQLPLVLLTSPSPMSQARRDILGRLQAVLEKDGTLAANSKRVRNQRPKRGRIPSAPRVDDAETRLRNGLAVTGIDGSKIALVDARGGVYISFFEGPEVFNAVYIHTLETNVNCRPVQQDSLVQSILKFFSSLLLRADDLLVRQSAGVAPARACRAAGEFSQLSQE